MEPHPSATVPASDEGWQFRGRPAGLVAVAAYKGIWGVLEIIAGILLFFSSQLIARELVEDPQDLLARWIIRTVHLTPTGSTRIGAIVVLLGIGKVIVAYGVWHRSYAIRTIAIAALSILAGFGIYEMVVVRFSIFRFLAFAVDVCILYYFYAVLPRHFHQH